jgi:hypothetical protein
MPWRATPWRATPWCRCVVLASMVAIGLVACEKEKVADEEETEQVEEETEEVETTAMDPGVTDMDPGVTDMAETTDMTTEMAPEQPPGGGGIGASAATDGGSDGPRYRHDQAGLHGERITYYQKPTPEGCESDCAGNEACAGWTFIRKGFYNPNDPGMCYLMSKATEWQLSPCCISGVKAGL